MSNLCGYCEHSIVIHSLGFGRCTGESHDIDYGRYACLCPHFEKDSDD